MTNAEQLARLRRELADYHAEARRAHETCTRLPGAIERLARRVRDLEAFCRDLGFQKKPAGRR